jgi:hypothetical protein
MDVKYKTDLIFSADGLIRLYISGKDDDMAMLAQYMEIQVSMNHAIKIDNLLSRIAFHHCKCYVEGVSFHGKLLAKRLNSINKKLGTWMSLYLWLYDMVTEHEDNVCTQMRDNKVDFVLFKEQLHSVVQNELEKRSISEKVE